MTVMAVLGTPWRQRLRLGATLNVKETDLIFEKAYFCMDTASPRKVYRSNSTTYSLKMHAVHVFLNFYNDYLVVFIPIKKFLKRNLLPL